MPKEKGTVTSVYLPPALFNALEREVSRRRSNGERHGSRGAVIGEALERLLLRPASDRTTTPYPGYIPQAEQSCVARLCTYFTWYKGRADHAGFHWLERETVEAATAVQAHLLGCETCRVEGGGHCTVGRRLTRLAQDYAGLLEH